MTGEEAVMRIKDHIEILAFIVTTLVLFNIAAVYAALTVSSYWDDVEGE
jgi:hypothetical protein